MKKIILISALLVLSFSAGAQMKASLGYGLEWCFSISKSPEFFHFQHFGFRIGADLMSPNEDMLFLGAGFDAGICGENFLVVGKGERLVLCPFYVDAIYDFNNIGFVTGGLYAELRGGIAFGGLASQIGSRIYSKYFAIGAGYQVDDMSIGLEWSRYPGMTATIDGYTVESDSVGSNIAIKFCYRFGKNRY